jgi:hypothetical protein
MCLKKPIEIEDSFEENRAKLTAYIMPIGFHYCEEKFAPIFF